MSKNSQINPNKNSLDSIKFPYDLRQLNVESLKHIAEEVRKEMIKSVSETGGHLGAGLGVVELTVAYIMYSILLMIASFGMWDIKAIHIK